MSELIGEPIKIFHCSDVLNSVIHPKRLDPTKQRLVIFDDFVTAKNQENILEYFTYSRKYNCSAVYVSQDWTMIPKALRNNLHYALIFRCNDQEDLDRIYRRYVNKIVSKEEFMNLYKSALQENYYGFITIDNKTDQKERAVRIGLL